MPRFLTALALAALAAGCAAEATRDADPFAGLERTATGCWARGTGTTGEVRFETLCPPAYTQDFTESLQRALAARGVYRGHITGEMDAATQGAILRWQAERGLASGILALETARAFGLVITETVPRAG